MGSFVYIVVMPSYRCMLHLYVLPSTYDMMSMTSVDTCSSLDATAVSEKFVRLLSNLSMLTSYFILQTDAYSAMAVTWSDMLTSIHCSGVRRLNPSSVSSTSI